MCLAQSTKIRAIAASTILIAGCAELLPDRTEATVREVIEAHWNDHRISLALGDVRFKDAAWSSECKPDLTRGEVCLYRLRLYHGLDSLGLLSVEDERDLTQDWSGWEGWRELTSAGVRRTARVELTSAGRARYDTDDLAGGKIIQIPTGIGSITEVMAIDSVAGTATKFLVVQGKHTYRMSEEVAASLNIADEDNVAKHLTFKALLKFEPLKERWVVLLADTGTEGGDFSTLRVDEALACLKMAGTICPR